MAAPKDIKLYLYLDGISFPIRSFSRVNMPGAPTFATITIPPHQKAITDIEPRTMVHVFYEISGDDQKRLLFEGELSGRPYHKDPSGMNISLSAVSYLGLFNHAPLIYLEYMKPGITSIYDARNQFYGLDVKTQGTRRFALEQYFWYEIGEEAGRLILANKIDENGIWEFFQKYFTMILGTLQDMRPLNNFIYYANRRMKLGKDIMVLEDDMVKAQYRAETIAKLIQNLTSYSMDPNTMTTLNVVLQNMAQYQYRLFSIPSPTYISRKALTGTSALIPYWEKAEGRRSEFYAPGYIILPDVMFALPPKCNVLKSRKQDNLSININDYKITRLLNQYTADWIKSSEDDLTVTFLSASYPEQIEADRKSKVEQMSSNERIHMTEYESKYGMIPTHQNKDWLYNRLFHDYRTEENSEQEMREIRAFVQADVKHDFYKLRYRDTIEYTTPRFLPGVVAGFPGMIYDESIEMKYYGMISRVTLSIDQDSPTGGVSTNIQFTNALMADKFAPMNHDTLKLYDEQQRERVGQYLPMNPFVDQRNLGPANIGRFYESILGCGAHDYNLWLNREYPEREIITLQEYLRNKEITKIIELDAIGEQVEIIRGREEEGKKRPDLPDLARLTPGNHHEDDNAPRWLKNYIDIVDRKGLVDLLQLRGLYESKRI